MQKITPHDLRHTCASLAVSAGVNVLALQRMLVHTSAKMTLDTYADLSDDDLDAVDDLQFSISSGSDGWVAVDNIRENEEIPLGDVSDPPGFVRPRRSRP